MCQIYLLDPGLKLLESNTLKAAVPQNVKIVRTLPHATPRIARRSLYVRRTDCHKISLRGFAQYCSTPGLLLLSRLVVKSSHACFTSPLVSYLQAFLCLSISPFLFSFSPQKSLILKLLHLYPTIPCDKMFKQIDQVFWYTSYFNFSGFLCVHVDSAEFSPSGRIPARQ